MKNTTKKTSKPTHSHTRLSKHLRRMHHDLDELGKFFEKEPIKNTIVFFGSAQTCSCRDAQRQMHEVELKFERSKRRTEQQWDALDTASNAVYMSRYYHAAEDLAYKLALWSQKFKRPQRKYLICSGGGPGIMEATNKGSHRAGAASIGLRIRTTLEQDDNLFIDPDLKFRFHYFFFRKFCFLYFARAIVAFPGGVGTVDEIFELLNLLRTKKIKRSIPLILFGTEYWKNFLNFDVMLRYDTVDKKNLADIHYFNDVDETFHFITHHLKKK